MHKQLNLGLLLGLIGNALFVGFGFVCYIYYLVYDPDSAAVTSLEILVYTLVFSGFGALVVSEVLIVRTVRMRRLLKIGFALYICMEAFFMYCELNSFDVLSFYDPYSLPLAIVHSIVSAVICFAFLSLDPYKTNFEVVVIVCVGLILGGMFGNLMGIRLYFSILVNAVSFTALFVAIRYLMKREEIEIDCYGDKARVSDYSQKDFFE